MRSLKRRRPSSTLLQLSILFFRASFEMKTIKRKRRNLL
jgi:hypothetical protein